MNKLEVAKEAFDISHFTLQAIVAVAFFMESIDGSMISTALPAIAMDLHVVPLQLRLAFASYFLAMAAFIPISGWCADRFGARNIFCVSVGVLILSSIACACASTFFEFVIARGFQGAGGAMMFPVGRLIVVRSIPKSELLRAFSNITIPSTVGAISGPMLGGFLTTYLHWTWMFWINVPIGIIVIILGIFYIPEMRNKPAPFDFTGFLLAGFALSCLGYGLIAVTNESLAGYAAATLIAAGIAATWVYLRRASRQEAPILNVKLLRINTYRTGLVGGFIVRAADAGAFSFLLPLLFQVGFGLTPLQSGSLTFASAVGSFASKFAVRRMLSHFGFRRVLGVNALLGGLVIAWLALLLPGTPDIVIIVMLFTGGICRSLQYMGLETLSYADIPKHAMSQASTVTSLFKQFAIAVGVAYAAIVLQGVSNVRGYDFADIVNFKWAFLFVAFLPAATALIIQRLTNDAGGEVSGNKLA